MKQMFKFKLEDGTVVTGANPVEALMQVKASTTGKSFDDKFKKEKQDIKKNEALVEFEKLYGEYLELEKELGVENKPTESVKIIEEGVVEQPVEEKNALEVKTGELFYDNLDANAKEEFIKSKSRHNRDAFDNQTEFIENYEKIRNEMKKVLDMDGSKEELLLAWGIHPPYLDSIKGNTEEIENSYKQALEEYGLNR